MRAIIEIFMHKKTPNLDIYSGCEYMYEIVRDEFTLLNDEHYLILYFFDFGGGFLTQLNLF